MSRAKTAVPAANGQPPAEAHTPCEAAKSSRTAVSTRSGQKPEKVLRKGWAHGSKGPMQLRRTPTDVARLYGDHASRVHRWVLRFCPATDAEEVVHEIFVKVLERIAQFRAHASPTTWLYRLTTNHCINRLRDTGRRAQLWNEHSGTMWASPVATADQETVAFLHQLWHSLDDELVEIGLFHFVDGMTHAEIARVVGCSARTVGNRLMRLQSLAIQAAGDRP